jgi:uncharacterized protein (DUF433 family)
MSCCGFWPMIRNWLQARKNRLRTSAEVVEKTHFGTESMPKQRLERITIEPGKCGGSPCLRGYRIRVSDLLALLSAGASHAEILEDYPFLEEEDIYAALEYATIQTSHPIVIAA